MIRPDRGGNDEGSDTRQVSRVVTGENADTKRLEISLLVEMFHARVVAQPLTTTPRRQAMSASALMPAPPIPMKCTVRVSEGLNKAISDGLM